MRGILGVTDSRGVSARAARFALPVSLLVLGVAVACHATEVDWRPQSEAPQTHAPPRIIAIPGEVVAPDANRAVSEPRRETKLSSGPRESNQAGDRPVMRLQLLASEARARTATADKEEVELKRTGMPPTRQRKDTNAAGRNPLVRLRVVDEEPIATYQAAREPSVPEREKRSATPTPSGNVNQEQQTDGRFVETSHSARRGIRLRDEIADKNVNPVYDSLISTLLRAKEEQPIGLVEDRPAARLQLTIGGIAIPDEMSGRVVRLPSIHPVSTVAHLQGMSEVGSVVARPDDLAKPPDQGPSEEVLEFKPRSIGLVTTDITLPKEEKRPPDESRAVFAERDEARDETFATREWPHYLYQWEPSSLYHRPLYFEEVNLERYGYSCCPLGQPLISGARFFTTVPILPYKMAVEPICECTYSLGHYRPGSCAPNRIHWIPLRPKAGAVEAAAVTGLIFAIP